MTHPSEEDLLDLALGVPVDATVEEHLRGCPQCRAAHAHLLRAVIGVRGSGQVTLEAPPPSVWVAIEAELDAEAGAAESQEEAGHEAAPDAAAGAAPDAAAGAAPDAAAGAAPDGQVVPLARADRRTTPAGAARAPAPRWRTRALLAAACLVGIGLGSIATVAVTSRAPAGTTLAAADLTTLDTRQRLGRADVIASADQVDLRLEIQPIDPGSGFLEVWLINRDLKRMVSVGVIPAGSTQADIPVTRRLLDEGYTVVDISREAFDDKPQHSGDSVVRGALSL